MTGHWNVVSPGINDRFAYIQFSELRKQYETKDSKPHTTVIKMEPPPTQASVQREVQHPVCNHPQFPSNGQPLVQTVFVPQPYYPPQLPPQYFQQQQQGFQPYQPYQFGQPPPPKLEESKQPSPKAARKNENKQAKAKKDNVSIDVEFDDVGFDFEHRILITSNFSLQV